MLWLLTATPGSGKTLFLLDRVHKQAEQENRQVYYHGITLTELGQKLLKWLPLDDPTKWFELPPGAIIVVDECQDHFPPRRTGTHVPDHIRLFAKHRHQGFDIWLITQGPHLVDSFIRELVNKHIHLRRIFGMQTAQVINWDCCEQKPNSVGAAARSLDKYRFQYPKKIYDWYISAQVHTHKVKIPRIVWWMLFCIFLAIPALYFSVTLIAGLGNKPAAIANSKKPGVTPSAAPSGTVVSDQVGITQRQASAPVEMTAEQILASFIPKLADRPETAPRYANMAQPTTFPRLSGCVKSRRSCKCYTQQATIIDVSPEVCGELVEHARFDDYAQPSQPQQQGQGGRVADTGPMPLNLHSSTLPQQSQSMAPPVVTMNDGRGVNLLRRGG